MVRLEFATVVSFEEVAEAIRALPLNPRQLDPTLAPRLLSYIAGLGNSEDLELLKGLTPRELEILKLIGQGKNNKEIGAQLHLGEGTVKNKVSMILAQLGLRDRTQVAVWVQKNRVA